MNGWDGIENMQMDTLKLERLAKLLTFINIICDCFPVSLYTIAWPYAQHSIKRGTKG